MQQFEYKKVITQSISEDQLQQLGKDGYRLAGVQGNCYYFERPIEKVEVVQALSNHLPIKPKRK